MPQELDGLSDRVLSHWFPIEKSSHAGAGRAHEKDRVVKEMWEGAGPSRMKDVI